MRLAATRLEYAYAFDQAASCLGVFPSPLLGVVSTPEFADLVLARAEGGVAFLCDGEGLERHVRRRLKDGCVPLDITRQSRVLEPGAQAPAGQRFEAAIWASPQPVTFEGVLASIGALTAPGGALCVLAGTRVGGLTAPLRLRRQAGEPVPCRGLHARLAAEGWAAIHSLALGGMASGAWALASRAARLAHREDLADRAEHAHHRAIADPVGGSYELTLLVRRRA